MPSPAAVVESAFAQAQSYATLAQSSLTGFTDALNATIYAPPTISVSWSSVAPPTLPTLPSTPTMPSIAFSGPTAPDALALSEPTIVLDTFGEVAPVTTFPDAPVLSYGSAPVIPAVTEVAVPDAPTVVLPDLPALLTLNTPTFAGLDLHESYLTNLETIPTLTLVAPTPYSYSLGAEYSSALLSAVTAKLLERIAGGSGLTPAVEQAIWDRARDRETRVALANEQEVARTSEALGFQLPTGTLAVQLREAQQQYYDKLSEISRDVAIKQAELEQANLKDAISAGMELEGKLIDYSYKLEQLTFESARIAAENSIQSYNAQVESYKALLDAYRTYAAAYDTIIKGELAKVDVFRAEIAAEQTKADINKTLVDQYRVSVDALMSEVKIFEAQVGAAKVLVELEQAKIGTAAEQIKAYVAQVNAETAKIEAYKAGIDAEATKVQVYKVKADVFGIKVGAQVEELRANIALFQGLTQAKTAEWDGYRAQVEAERARLQALASQSGALLDGYKAGAAAIEASANMQTRLWETQIKDYEASQQLVLQAAKINNDAMLANRATNLDAAKVGAQVYAQLVSSAYSMIHASAGVSAGASTTVSYNYSGDTTGPVSPLASI